MYLYFRPPQNAVPANTVNPVQNNYFFSVLELAWLAINPDLELLRGKLGCHYPLGETLSRTSCLHHADLATNYKNELGRAARAS